MRIPATLGEKEVLLCAFKKILETYRKNKLLKP